MTDERLRVAERALDGSVESRLRLLREQVRAGQVEAPIGTCLDGLWIERTVHTPPAPRTGRPPVDERRFDAIEEATLEERLVITHPCGPSPERDGLLALLRARIGLRHPNLDEVAGAGVWPGGQRVWRAVTRRPRGAVLSWDSGPMEWRRATGLVRQAALGLGHVHARGGAHGAPGPADLFVADGDQVLVVDVAFPPGVRRAAARLDEAGSLDTSDLDQAAPETWLKLDGVGPRADVFSLGVTLYWLLAGLPPWPRRGGESPVVRVQRMRREPAPDVRTYARDTPWPVVAVVARCLEVDPARRFADGDALAAALHDALEGRAPPELPPAAPSPPTPPPAPEPRTWRDWLGL